MKTAALGHAALAESGKMLIGTSQLRFSQTPPPCFAFARYVFAVLKKAGIIPSKRSIGASRAWRDKSANNGGDTPTRWLRHNPKY
jgi:hypothetical protein